MIVHAYEGMTEAQTKQLPTFTKALFYVTLRIDDHCRLNCADKKENNTCSKRLDRTATHI